MLARAGDDTPTDRNGPSWWEGQGRCATCDKRDEEVESLRSEILQFLATIDELEPLRLEIAQLSTAVDEKDTEIERLRAIIEDHNIDIICLQDNLDEALRTGIFLFILISTSPLSHRALLHR